LISCMVSMRVRRAAATEVPYEIKSDESVWFVALKSIKITKVFYLPKVGMAKLFRQTDLLGLFSLLL